MLLSLFAISYWILPLGHSKILCNIIITKPRMSDHQYRKWLWISNHQKGKCSIIPYVTEYLLLQNFLPSVPCIETTTVWQFLCLKCTSDRFICFKLVQFFVNLVCYKNKLILVTWTFLDCIREEKTGWHLNLWQVLFTWNLTTSGRTCTCS